MDEDGSFLVDVKVKQKSPVQADVWTPESIPDVHLCARWNTVTCKSPGGARSEGALSPSTAAVQPAAEEPCPAEDWSWCEEGQKVAADVVYYSSVCCSYQTNVWDALSLRLFFHFIACTSDGDTEPQLGLSSSWFALPSTVMKSN